MVPTGGFSALLRRRLLLGDAVDVAAAEDQPDSRAHLDDVRDLARAIALVDTSEKLSPRARDLFRGILATSGTNTLIPLGMLMGLGNGFMVPPALAGTVGLLPALAEVLAAAPFRNMLTPGGFTMSVGLSSCGSLGWTTDRSGYRYTPFDPLSGRPWPAMPTTTSSSGNRPKTTTRLQGLKKSKPPCW